MSDWADIRAANISSGDVVQMAIAKDLRSVAKASRKLALREAAEVCRIEMIGCGGVREATAMQLAKLIDEMMEPKP